MATLNLNKKYASTLKALNYNIEDAINEFLLLKLSGKIAEFTEDCSFYEKKYKTIFKAFEKKINNKSNDENFEEYDDYLAWKFAEESKRYYQNNLDRLK